MIPTINVQYRRNMATYFFVLSSPLLIIYFLACLFPLFVEVPEECVGEYANCCRREAEGIPLCVLDCLTHRRGGIEGENIDD